MKIVLLVFSLFLGSIPFGIVVAKLFGGPDPRTIGSGNIGATNVARAAGVKAGILTLILDMLKGVIPVVLARTVSQADWLPFACGFLAILGHCYSPFLSFRGGKGVATGAGVFAALSFKAFLLAFLCFSFVFAVTRIVSLSSILSALSMPIWIFVVTKSTKESLFTLFVALLVIWRHKDNIKRLLKGEESKFVLKK